MQLKPVRNERPRVWDGRHSKRAIINVASRTLVGWSYRLEIDVKIEDIRWLSKEADEAEVLVSDGSYRCEAYSQPCNVKVGDALEDRLHLFGIRDAMLTETTELGVHKLDSAGLAQRVVARVSDAHEGYLTVGAIQFAADDPLPGGIRQGDIITLECARIDLW